MGEAKYIYFTCLNFIRFIKLSISSSFINLTKMGDRSCYNCGEPGHISRECPKPRSGGGGGGGSRACYNCNEEGHISRDCPMGGGGRGGGGNCYNCNQPGHLSRDCTEPRSGGSRFGGGG